jgi:hypothetical protein
VVELIALGMVTAVRMIESEMDYRAAKPCLNGQKRSLRWIEDSLFISLDVWRTSNIFLLGP